MGGGGFLIVKLDNAKACNDECHSVSRIYFVIIYYSPLKTNNSVIIFAMCNRSMKFLSELRMVRGTRYMVVSIILL